MRKPTKRSLDTALEQIIGHIPAEHTPEPKAEAEKTKPNIIGRRDERGTPYPGDFPNTASDRNSGCF